jgi:deoxyribodipyrimidine photo-lyase
MKNKLSLFIFRRDLRLVDNTALNIALSNSERVICGFIFDPRQISDHAYKSQPGLSFMVNSLIELQKELQERGGELYFWNGLPGEVIKDLSKELPISSVYVNSDYTPFARARDLDLKNTCDSLGINFEAQHDLLLNHPGAVLKENGQPYQIYTPFYRASSKIEVRQVAPLGGVNFWKGELSLKTIAPAGVCSDKPVSSGGREEALRILEQIGNFSKYDEERNLPAISGTTGLAPHNKFGTISCREFYHAVRKAFSKEHTLIRELYWRDFFSHIGFHFPHVFSGCFTRKYDQLKWSNDQSKFEAWCEGRTGFPIVDAGMRELKESGFMHNRVRMIVASFLTKDLLIDWRWGEKHFARNLTDYDPAVNNGNWQWAASTGCDAQPYFRIFNPWMQQDKFDPECIYIKKWVKELRGLSAREIHGLIKTPEGLPILGYPAQIVDHKEAKIDAEEMFRAVV